MMKKQFYLLFFLIFLGCSYAEPEDIDIQDPKSNPCFLGPNSVGCLNIITDPNNPSQPTPKFRYFHNGRSNRDVYWGQSTNGASWSVNGTVNNARTDTGPAAVYHNNQLHVFYTGEHSNALYRSNSSDGSTWSGNVPINTDVDMRRDVSAISYGGKIWVSIDDEAHIGQNYITSTDGFTWSELQSFPGTEYSGFPPSFVEFEGDLYAVMTLRWGRVWLSKYNAANDTWGMPTDLVHPTVVIPPPNCNTGSCTAGYVARGPVTAAVLNGYIYIAYERFDNGHLEVWGYDPNNTIPGMDYTSSVYADGQKSNWGPTMVSDGNRLVMVFKSRTDFRIRYTTSTDGFSWSSGMAVGETRNRPFILHYTD